MLKATWHWGRDCSVLNDPPLGSQAAPHCMLAFRPHGAPWRVTKCFPHFLWEGSIFGIPTDINEWINHWLWRWSFSLHRDPVGKCAGGGLICQRLWGKDVEEILETGASLSLSVEACWGTWGFCWLGILRDSWRALEREHLSLWELHLGGSFLGSRKDMGRRAQWTDITLWGSIHQELWEIVVRGLWKLGISLYGSSVRGTWRGGFFSRGPEGYQRKALGMDNPLYGG